jgi:hypothetical protein
VGELSRADNARCIFGVLDVMVEFDVMFVSYWPSVSRPRGKLFGSEFDEMFGKVDAMFVS